MHNYQRFHKIYSEATTLPFIVAGAGRFDELHGLAQTDQNADSTDHRLIKDVKLMNYYDTQHDFLKITLERAPEGITLSGEYYTIPHQLEPEAPATLADRFSYNFKRNS